VFSTQAFYEQFTYSIGLAQVAMITFAINEFVLQKSFSKNRIWINSFLASVMSVPLISNIPQAIATWLFVLIIWAIGYSYRNPEQNLGFKFAILLCCISAINAPFIYWFFVDLDMVLLRSDEVSSGGFENAGLKYVIQGFGKWSLFDQNWHVPHYVMDVQIVRQAIRLFIACIVFSISVFKLLRVTKETTLILVVRVFLLTPMILFLLINLEIPLYVFLIVSLAILKFNMIFDRYHLLVDSNNESDSLILQLFAITLFSLIAAYIGSNDWYWRFRDAFPPLGAFREPWAKFSMIYVLGLFACFAKIINDSLIDLKKRKHSFWISAANLALLMVTLNLVTPMFNNEPNVWVVTEPDTPFVQPSVKDWRDLDRQLNRLQSITGAEKICLANFDARNFVAYNTATRFPTKLLRLSEYESVNDQKENCLQDTKLFKLIALPASRTTFTLLSDGEINQECEIFSSEFFEVYALECDVKIERDGLNSYTMSVNG